MTVVILSAIVPTAIAQRVFSPPLHALPLADEEFEPPPLRAS